MRFAIKHLLRAAIIALVVVAPLIGYISVGYLSPTGVVVTAAESIKPPEAPQHHVSIWSHIKNGVRRVLDSVGVDAEAIKLYAKWVVGAPILVMGVLIALLLRPTRKPRDKAPGDGPTQHSIDKASDDAPVRIESKPAKPNVAKPRASIQSHPKPSVKLSSKQQVLRFFLNLYKNKQGADPEAPVQLVRTETRPVCPDETYEMRLMHKEEWVTRRMSIGLLGQGGGSRSQCYYVIYDSHMVIKIPSVPMTKFTEYRRQIAAEGRILSRLSPRECIVPRVSVILTAFLTFPGNQQLSEEALEARYMRHLENNPDFQEHLKIGDSFAFFMDLAKHLFLSTTLEEIHSDKGRLLDEARQHPDLLWDQHAFVCRYGEEAGGVCQSLQEAYFRCEAELRRLAETAGMENSISTYHLKQWFLTHIVGEKLRREEFDLPVNVIEKVNAALAEVVKDNSHAAKRYRRQLHDYVRDTRFSQHRRQFEGLASNMLDLLAWIRQKGLAMRDLKPENLFVAGNPEEYPVFLNTPEKFSIGLIDVETAVPIDAEDPILIPQPQLAGTPLYATPAHLMSNAILMEVYEDLAAILHLQDWFATIGIIYKIISGENLFGTTAHVFPDILSRLKVVDPAGPDLKEDVAKIQRLFWNSAMAEFQDAMAKHAELFAGVEVVVPDVFVGDLLAQLKREAADIEKAVAKAVTDQSFFNSGDKRRFLKVASSVKITQMMNKLTQEDESSSDSPQALVLLYFELLQKLKRRLEIKQQAIDSIKASYAAITADQLLEVMFQMVFNAMYLPEWPALAPRLYGTSSFLATDVTTYQATM